MNAFWLLLLPAALFNACMGAPIDLLEDPLPAGAAVYWGSFSDGGVYRMLRPNRGFVKRFYYGKFSLLTVDRLDSCYTDYYVEEYKRADKVFIYNTVVTNGVFRTRYRHTLYEITNVGVRSNKQALSEYLNGPVYLVLDVGNPNTRHPYIKSYKDGHESLFDASYKIFKSYSGCRERLTAHPNCNHYRISPVFDSRLPVTSDVRPTCVLYGSITDVMYNSDAHQYIVDVRKGMHMKTYYVEPSKGVIRAISSAEAPKAHWQPFSGCEDDEVRSDLSIVLDVGKIRQIDENLLVLENVRKGDWLYSRHEVVLYEDVKVVDVQVVNSLRNTIIYRSPRNVLVTHVERVVQENDGPDHVLIHCKIAKDNSVYPVIEGYVRLPGTDHYQLFRDVDTTVVVSAVNSLLSVAVPDSQNASPSPSMQLD
ncbi:spherical body protein, putative [Babesia caballi]|uniref:Spherical body protein, putative n=1 Tax=Babesia caballi TaxID=5871 RepID=A0AAV4LRV1_BABCB|nr:spherical body protein, putative [Babesia caballi]GIX62540.1 spherical body protein, putative [Babesia caballi]